MIFLDLPDAFSDPDSAAAVIVPIPYDETSTWKSTKER